MGNIDKIEEFVNISDGYGLGHISIFSENNRGWGYGSSSGLSGFSYGYGAGHIGIFSENNRGWGYGSSSYGYGAGIGIEIHRNGCYGDGAACIEKSDEIVFNKGTGRTNAFDMLSSNYKNSGGGGGEAQGF